MNSIKEMIEKVLERVILLHFKCPNCHAEFYLPTTPGTISCPNPQCHLLWAPKTMGGAFERGEETEFLRRI